MCIAHECIAHGVRVFVGYTRLKRSKGKMLKLIISSSCGQFKVNDKVSRMKFSLSNPNMIEIFVYVLISRFDLLKIVPRILIVCIIFTICTKFYRYPDGSLQKFPPYVQINLYNLVAHNVTRHRMMFIIPYIKRVHKRFYAGKEKKINIV